MTQDNNEILTQIFTLLEPFNTKGLELTADTSFTTDLELDSLAVMDFVAAIEDHFDITVPLNILPDLEKVGQVSAAVEKILKDQ
ncbi:acyl carrier protein [Luteithermobacter gelatinilyticus]|uniref:acyl carrier protein n=1 Tax=Luteithermobacter gelatinilyticus TaxID=2582913 RepID=UPI001107452B|nr:acyl carrier protein [Luteithermobacter gelatinilyticus]